MAIQNVDPRRCIGCKTCIATCPVDVFRFDEKSNQAITTYPEACQICQMCANVCPVGAITVTSDKMEKILIAWG